MQNGWNMQGISGAWHTMVNAVNFADLALHCWYITVLFGSLRCQASSVLSLPSSLPAGILAVGLTAAYWLAEVLPAQLSRQPKQLLSSNSPEATQLK